MESMKRETLAALIKALIVLGKPETEEDTRIQNQYTQLITRLYEKYNCHLLVREITDTDEFEEFSKIKDPQVVKDFTLILAEIALSNEFKPVNLKKYRYLSRLICALWE